MIEKIYIPAMIVPILNGIRLGFGVCVIGVLLAETKLSNQGVGFLISESYRCFNMPEMYALLILIFILAATANSLLEMAARRVHSGR